MYCNSYRQSEHKMVISLSSLYTFQIGFFHQTFLERKFESPMGAIGIYLGLGKKQGLLEMAKLLNNPLLPLLLFPCWLYIKCFKLPTLYSNGYGLGSNPLYCRKFVKAQLEKNAIEKCCWKDLIKDFFYVVSHCDGLKLENRQYSHM